MDTKLVNSDEVGKYGVHSIIWSCNWLWHSETSLANAANESIILFQYSLKNTTDIALLAHCEAWVIFYILSMSAIPPFASINSYVHTDCSQGRIPPHTGDTTSHHPPHIPYSVCSLQTGSYLDAKGQIKDVSHWCGKLFSHMANTNRPTGHIPIPDRQIKRVRTWFETPRGTNGTNEERHVTCYLVNRLRPRQNGCHFADDIFKCIFLNENVSIVIKISLKFISKGPINNIPSLVQIMAWHRPGDKPLSEPMMLISSTHKCVTQPQWVN